jgi:hypothetical protein
LVSDARLLARDPSSSNRPRFTDVQIKEFINEGQRDAISDTMCIRKSTTFELVIDQRLYDLPSDFIAMHRLTLENEIRKETSPKQKDQKLEQWEIVTGRPQEYYIDFTQRTKVGMYPFPSGSTELGTIKIAYFAQATDLSLDADIPFNSIEEFTPFHKMLAYYSAARMTEIDGVIGLTNRYMSKYLEYKSRFYNYCRKRPAYQPGLNVEIDNVR